MPTGEPEQYPRTCCSQREPSLGAQRRVLTWANELGVRSGFAASGAAGLSSHGLASADGRGKAGRRAAPALFLSYLIICLVVPAPGLLLQCHQLRPRGCKTTPLIPSPLVATKHLSFLPLLLTFASADSQPQVLPGIGGCPGYLDAEPREDGNAGEARGRDA